MTFNFRLVLVNLSVGFKPYFGVQSRLGDGLKVQFKTQVQAKHKVVQRLVILDTLIIDTFNIYLITLIGWLINSCYCLYLSQHLTQHVATRQTRSTALPLLTIPRIKTEFARRSYSYSASFIWNSLPSDVLYCNSEPTFKKHLKTFLSNSCFYAT